MKAMNLIPVVALSLFAMQVYAGDNPDTYGTAPNSNAAMTEQSVGGMPGGTTSSGAPVGKTRAQVYQELIRAQQDGTMDRINALYGGGD